MSHDEFNELVGGYVLSALDSDELKRFEAHLASCDECRDNVAEMLPLVDALNQSSSESEPSSDLKARIIASAVVEPKSFTPASQLKRAPWWRRPILWPLPVAAVVTALAVALAVVSVWGSQTDDDLSSAQRRLGLTYDGIEIMAQADQWWRFSGEGVSFGANGTLAY